MDAQVYSRKQHESFDIEHNAKVWIWSNIWDKNSEVIFILWSQKTFNVHVFGKKNFKIFFVFPLQEDVERVAEHDVFVRGGRRFPADIIIYATGYTFRFPYLRPELLIPIEVWLYKSYPNRFWIKFSTLNSWFHFPICWLEDIDLLE